MSEKLTDAALRYTLEVCEGRTREEAATILGIKMNTLRDRRALAGKRGLLGYEPVIEGMEIGKISNTPTGVYIQQRPARPAPEPIPDHLQVDHVSLYTDGNGGEIGRWTKFKPGAVDPIALVEAIKEAFADFKPVVPTIPAPVEVDEGGLTVVPLADLHMGLHAWKKDSGKSWDLETAVREYRYSLGELFKTIKPRNKCVILGGGDATHADDNKNVTPGSGHKVDVDGRHEKVVLETCHLFVYIIDKALALHRTVDVRLLKGNHDESTCTAIIYFLLAWYRNEPRVWIDIDPSYFWFYRFGKTFLGATHGHAAKAAKIPQLMAVDRPDDWAASRYRYGHAFHVHHKEKLEDEIMGVVVDVHRAPVPRDSWHSSMGFRSGRAFSASFYSAERGYKGCVNIELGDVD